MTNLQMSHSGHMSYMTKNATNILIVVTGSKSMEEAVDTHVKVATFEGTIPEASMGTNPFSYHFLISV